MLPEVFDEKHLCGGSMDDLIVLWRFPSLRGSTHRTPERSWRGDLARVYRGSTSYIGGRPIWLAQLVSAPDDGHAASCSASAEHSRPRYNLSGWVLGEDEPSMGELGLVRWGLAFLTRHSSHIFHYFSVVFSVCQALFDSSSLTEWIHWARLGLLWSDSQMKKN